MHWCVCGGGGRSCQFKGSLRIIPLLDDPYRIHAGLDRTKQLQCNTTPALLVATEDTPTIEDTESHVEKSSSEMAGATTVLAPPPSSPPRCQTVMCCTGVFGQVLVSFSVSLLHSPDRRPSFWHRYRFRGFRCCLSLFLIGFVCCCCGWCGCCCCCCSGGCSVRSCCRYRSEVGGRAASEQCVR